MITTPESSPSKITPSPSLSPQRHQSPQSSQLRDITRQAAKIPQSHFPTQTQVADKATFRVVDEYAKEDSFKEGRKITEIDKDPTISLVQPEQDREYDFDVSTAEGFTTSSVPITTAKLEISTTNILVSTAGAAVNTASAFISIISPPRVSTAEDISGAETLVYIRMSASKDKGKAIMTEPEPEQTTTKLQQRQERAGFEAAIRLQELFDEEERQRLARQEDEKYDLQKALELQKQLDEREEVVAKVHDIDWSDPAVLRYHAVQNRSFSIAEVRKNMCIYLKNQGGYKQSHFKGMSYEDMRPIFERVWDQNHAFVPKDSEIEKEVMERSGFDLQQESSKQVEEEIF
ncbi:hypothetical protein Tco_1289573 [Tanacetum coccineum]